ncbi:PDR/VanB family oxidoreductase [Brevibacterium litoralis]|uniref:PDR/VanB family oxidoreductase n=1 Tax=Brevibacterium litoralis TaxID=3138935 RepID=UPI0032EE2153
MTARTDTAVGAGVQGASAVGAAAGESAEVLPPVLREGMDLVVDRVVEETAGIRSIAFVDPHGHDLPGYVPGSHLVLACRTAEGLRTNAYSLTGSGLFPEAYTISVLRESAGRGGSRWVHGLRSGDTVRVSRPRSAFPPVVNATHLLLVAAGIGITPILSHLRAALERGTPVTVLYVHRPGEGAHAQVVRDLVASTPGAELVEYSDRHAFTEAFGTRVRRCSMGTHVFTCGPGPFMEAVEETALAAGWPAARIHSEAFGLADLDPGTPFTAVLARSGDRVPVPAGVSLLEALEGVGRSVPNMCRQGVCGECRLKVTRGPVTHRDTYLSDEEKDRGDAVMCCVSRAATDEMEIDL